MLLPDKANRSWLKTASVDYTWQISFVDRSTTQPPNVYHDNRRLVELSATFISQRRGNCLMQQNGVGTSNRHNVRRTLANSRGLIQVLISSFRSL